MADDELTRKDAEMLTREEIEAAHDALCASVAMHTDMSRHWCEQRWKQAHALCDLALQALSLESVREEALEEAAKACDVLRQSDAPTDRLIGYEIAAENIRALQSPARVAEGGESVKMEWFRRGRESVLRKNQSGCCCLFNEDDEIVSVCMAHKEWAALASAPESPTKERLMTDAGYAEGLLAVTTKEQEQRCNKDAAPSRVVGQTTGYPGEPANPEAGVTVAAPDVAAMVKEQMEYCFEPGISEKLSMARVEGAIRTLIEKLGQGWIPGTGFFAIGCSNEGETLWLQSFQGGVNGVWDADPQTAFVFIHKKQADAVMTIPGIAAYRPFCQWITPPPPERP